MSISWSDELKTGIADIDEQHQSLFETVNKLDKAKESREIFYEALIEFETYMLLHFKTEEEYMRDALYFDYEHHKECHDKFIFDFKKLFKQISSQASVLDLRTEMIAFLEGWIKEHYTVIDVKMAKFLNQNSTYR